MWVCTGGRSGGGRWGWTCWTACGSVAGAAADPPPPSQTALCAPPPLLYALRHKHVKRSWFLYVTVFLSSYWSAEFSLPKPLCVWFLFIYFHSYDFPLLGTLGSKMNHIFGIFIMCLYRPNFHPLHLCLLNISLKKGVCVSASSEPSPLLGTDMTVMESCCIIVIVVSGISVSRSIRSHIP